jgi:hypothetical protein
MQPFRPSEKKINFGLDLTKNEQEKIRPTNKILGAVDKQVLRPDGQWLDQSPECEIQKTDTDDLMDCVTESSINAEKLILERKFNVKKNGSQRFRAKMSGTTHNGNSLYAVANSARKDGSVLETDWPRDRSMSWNEYYATIPQAIKNLGLKFLDNYEVSYEQVPTNTNALKDALKYGPVQVIGYAWASDNGIYYDYGYTPNHAFLLVGYKPNGNWLVYDSYPTDFIIDSNSTKQEFTKELDKNFHFGDAMLYSFKGISTTTSKKKLLSLILSKTFMNGLWSFSDSHGVYFYFVKKVNGEYYKQQLDISNLEKPLKALFILFGENGLSRQTSYGEISQIKDKVFF